MARFDRGEMPADECRVRVTVPSGRLVIVFQILQVLALRKITLRYAFESIQTHTPAPRVIEDLQPIGVGLNGCIDLEAGEKLVSARSVPKAGIAQPDRPGVKDLHVPNFCQVID